MKICFDEIKQPLLRLEVASQLEEDEDRRDRSRVRSEGREREREERKRKRGYRVTTETKKCYDDEKDENYEEAAS